MSLRVVFRRAAKDEFENAAAWYEEQHRGLGEEFITEIGEAIEKAAQHPDRYPTVFGDVRRTVLRRFPYAVYFRQRQDALGGPCCVSRTSQSSHLAASSLIHVAAGGPRPVLLKNSESGLTRNSI